jgi:predicted secreted Zn-dependent protease
MEAISCDTSVRQHMTKLEHQVKYLKSSKDCSDSKDLIESIEETIMNLRIALKLSPKFIIEFDESELKSGDVIHFHPYDRSVV